MTVWKLVERDRAMCAAQDELEVAERAAENGYAVPPKFSASKMASGMPEDRPCPDPG